MQLGDWRETLTLTQTALQRRPNDVSALRMLVLHLLVRESSSRSVIERIGDLYRALDAEEPKNAGLYYSVAALCARLANRNHSVLHLTIGMAEKAAQL
jgi:tetratricopeptide repeat protein 21B